LPGSMSRRYSQRRLSLDLGMLPDLASQSLCQEGPGIVKLGEQLLPLLPSSANPSVNDFWLKQESPETLTPLLRHVCNKKTLDSSIDSSLATPAKIISDSQISVSLTQSSQGGDTAEPRCTVETPPNRGSADLALKPNRRKRWATDEEDRFVNALNKLTSVDKVCRPSPNT
jgi:hypothetical protein